MKMKLLDRVLLMFFTFLILFISIGLLGVSLGLIKIAYITDYLSTLQYGVYFALITLAIALATLFVSYRLLRAGLFKSKPNSSLLKVTELGVIRVSNSTLDNLAQKAVKSFNEVKDVKSIIIPESDGVKVQLRIVIMPDVEMPELTQSIQNKVKQYIQDLSGISVKEVQVFIVNLINSQRNRVE